MSAIEWFGSVVLGVFIIGYFTAELLDIYEDRRKERRK